MCRRKSKDGAGDQRLFRKEGNYRKVSNTAFEVTRGIGRGYIKVNDHNLDKVLY